MNSGNLFNRAHAEALLKRLDRITADSSPLWGKMNAAQMVQHCQAPLRAAFGSNMSKRGLMSYLFGRIFKNQLIGTDKPFSKNLPTDPHFMPADPRDFAQEKQQLSAEILAFLQKGKEAVTQNPHSFFGKMSGDEWGKLQWKHIDHHLRQFGA